LVILIVGSFTCSGPDPVQHLPLPQFYRIPEYWSYVLPTTESGSSALQVSMQ